MGSLTDSFGNFVLDIFANESSTTPALRTYHFDSDNKGLYSTTAAQTAWFERESTARNAASPAPALAFYHVPLIEYQTALDSGLPISGEINEQICFQPQNNGLFEAFKNSADVKAGFCGHDHTNDFCVMYQGVQLCYEGSPGYQVRSFPFVRCTFY